MVLILTLDNNNATRCVNKRQSKDSIVAKKMFALAGERPIYIKSSSLSFFSESELSGLTVTEDLLDTPDNAFVFLEEVPSAEILKRAEAVFVFRWNRTYPSMQKDRVDLSRYKRIRLNDYPGNSHDKITEEIYVGA